MYGAMRLRFVYLLVLLGCLEGCFGMTRAQLKKTMTVAKKQCVPKIGVSEDKINKIEEGVFIEDPKVMCFIACVYKSLQVIKNDRLDRDLITRQVDILYPNDMKAPVKKAIDKCFHVPKQHKDICEAAFWTTKCLYDADPATFIFP
ncbi:hypothetical protein evm_008383 [Chilo suppressalis]|nr:hypothetical protein evm_008383 [Chilo suppressalis]